jgi:hypothetical protein
VFATNVCGLPAKKKHNDLSFNTVPFFVNAGSILHFYALFGFLYESVLPGLYGDISRFDTSKKWEGTHPAYNSMPDSADAFASNVFALVC